MLIWGRGSCTAVSIHAAREGGDSVPLLPLVWLAGFNPRRPRGRRRVTFGTAGTIYSFQSTPPARAATSRIQHRERRNKVSIHAAREGGDAPGRRCSSNVPVFQSTPPARAATGEATHHSTLVGVSIHAAREGGDAAAGNSPAFSVCFNPRRPRGRRQ